MVRRPCVLQRSQSAAPPNFNEGTVARAMIAKYQVSNATTGGEQAALQRRAIPYAGSRSLDLAHYAGDGAGEIFRRNRLGQVHVIAGLERFFAIVFVGERRERDGGKLAIRSILHLAHAADQAI